MQMPAMHAETKPIPAGTVSMVLPELWRSLDMGGRSVTAMESHGDAESLAGAPSEPLESLVRIGARTVAEDRELGGVSARIRGQCGNAGN